MALDKLTIIDGGGLSTTSDYRVGIITATKFIGPIEGSITSTDANFTGTVTIGGTLTYEDVTNIDSVGLITARDGVFIPDNKKLELGNASGSPELEIYHDGNHSYIQESGTGNLFIDSSYLTFRNSAGNTTVATFSHGTGNAGGTQLYFGGSKKIITTNTGITVTGTAVADGADINGDIDVDGHTNLDNVSIAGVTTITGILYTASSVRINTTDDQALRLNSTDNGPVYMTFDRSGSRKAWIGYGNANNVLQLRNEISDGDLYFSVNDGGSTKTAISIDASENAKVNIPQDLDVDGHTNLDNVSIAGITTTTENIRIQANNKYFTVGASNQIGVVHTGGEAFITNSSGHFTHRSDVHKWENYAGSSESLRITSDRKIGINLTSPSSSLHVSNPVVLGSTAGNEQEIAKFQGAVGNAGILKFSNLRFSNGSDWTSNTFRIQRVIDVTEMGHIDFGTGGGASGRDIRFGNGDGTTYMHLDNTGEVGIGTDDPGAKLHLYGTDTRIRLSKSNAGANLKHWDIAAQGEILRLQAKNDAGSGGGNLFDFYRSGNQINEFRGMKAGAYWFVVDNTNQRVGIGTDNPSKTLHVFKSNEHPVMFERGDASNTQVELRTAGATRGYWGCSTTANFMVYDNDASDVNFTVLQTGNVGINASNPTEKLEVAGNLKVTGQIYQSMPADFWSQSTSIIELNGLGNLTHMGSYETCLTSNGYRDNNGQWKSYNINSYTGAAQIRLNPQGSIIFGTEANKADGDSPHVVDERLRITSAGEVLVNENTARSYVDGAGNTQTPKLQVEADDNNSSAISLTWNSGGGSAGRRASFMFARTADGSAVSNNSVLGEVLFMGEGNSTLEKAASIRAEVDGTPGTNDMPGRLIFSTSADGSDSPTERVRITSGGVALFGGLTSQTSDTSKLAVQGGDSNIGIIQVHAGGGENSGDLSGIAFSHGTDNTTARAKCAIASRATGAYGRGDLCFYVDGASDNNQVSAADEKLRIDSSGRLIVGGGTHAGGSALVVKGGNQNTYSTIGMFSNHTNPSNNTLLAQIRLGSNSTAVGANIRATAAGAWGTNDYPTRLDFYTTPDGTNSARQRLRIGHTGVIGINNNGNRTLHVQTSSDHGHIGVFAGENINSSNAATLFFLSTYRDENAGEYFMQFNKDQDNNGGGVQAVYYVTTRGDVKNKYNSYGSISDVKLKENIVDANSQWDDIKAIKVRNFNFKTDPDTKLLGVVAQEIETVSAGLVEDTPDKDITKEGDEGTSTKSVKYSVLYMKAIKCLQEAQARIETLEAEVAVLKGS